MGVPTAWFSASVETRGRFPRQSMAGGHLNKSDCVSQPPKVFLQHEARSHAQTPPKPNSALSLRVSRTGKATGPPLYLPGSPPPRPAPEGPQPLRAHPPHTLSSRSRRPRALRSAWTSSASSRHTSRRTWLPSTRAGAPAALCSSAEVRAAAWPACPRVISKNMNLYQ